MSELKLFLFGSPRVELNEKSVEIRRRKALALLVYLAVTGQSHSRDTLATLFWPDHDQSRARAYLRRALASLNKTLTGAWFDTDRESIGLNRNANILVDVEQFHQLLTAPKPHNHPSNKIPSESLSSLTEAASLYQADFLTGFTLRESTDFDEWQFFQAEGLRQELAATLEQLVAGYSLEREFEAALPHARRRLVLDPLHEPAHRELMKLYAWAGQHAAALRQYEECTRQMGEELGAPPEAETIELFEAIKTKQLSLPETTEARQRPMPEIDPLTPPASLATRHNLPPQTTPFIGREKELAALDALIASVDTRLVTIVGSGGMGKTRLSLASAEQQLKTDRFLTGVYFVSLAPLSEVDHIVPTLAEALDFPLDAGGQQKRSPKQQILDYLRQKKMLIVMDNFEHLLDGVELVADILEAAPEVQILVTSRERLHLHQEQIFAIQGLEFPDWETPEDAAEYTAVKLFVQSAQRVQHNFRLTTDDLTYLTRICHLVEGMPLGVELAAAWVEMLSLADIATELQQSLDFLETDVRNVPERHRSIRAVFDTSWQRMTETEQEIFPQLTIFRGGFTRQAAQEITGASLRLLGRLASKSLLQYSKARDRYQIHELLRQYGAEKLTNQTAEVLKTSAVSDVRNRHSAYYCAGLSQREADLKGARQQEALQEIETDSENVRIAWAWATEHKQAERLGQAAESLGLFYEWRGRFQEAEVAYGLAVTALTIETPTITSDITRILVKILAWQGRFNRIMSNIERAEQLLQQSLAILDNSEPEGRATRSETAFILLELGHIAFFVGDEDAKERYRESIALYRALNDRWGLAHALYALGEAIRWDGDLAGMRRLCEESLMIRRALNDRRGIAMSLSGLTFVNNALGEFDQAERFGREGVKVSQEIGDRLLLAIAFGDLGVVLIFGMPDKFNQGYDLLQQSAAIYRDLGMSIDGPCPTGFIMGSSNMYRGNYDLAYSQLEESLAGARSTGNSDVIPLALTFLGWTAIAWGKYPEARRWFQESVAFFKQVGRKNHLCEAVTGLGFVALRQGDLSEARQHLREALLLGLKSRSHMETTETLPAMSLLMAEYGQQTRAIELHILSLHQLPVTNLQWHQDVVWQHINVIAANLPPDVVDVAKARGRKLDLWETVAALVEELESDTSG